MEPIQPLQPSGPLFPRQPLPRQPLPRPPLPHGSSHPVTRADLKRFADGSADREEAAAIVRHLLRHCGGCAELLARLCQGRVGSSSDYDQAIDRSMERALAAFAVQTR
jgi:hypothetical protein